MQPENGQDLAVSGVDLTRLHLLCARPNHSREIYGPRPPSTRPAAPIQYIYIFVRQLVAAIYIFAPLVQPKDGQSFAVSTRPQ